MATTLDAKRDVSGKASGQKSKSADPDRVQRHHPQEFAQRYYTLEFMEREWRYLWPNVWLLAGVESDVAEPGDFLKFDIGHESIIVVRDDRGELRAFYNVCAHRGTPLVRDDFGSVRQFVCPLHSWKYALNGKNVGVTDANTFRPEVLCNDLNLSAVRVEALGGMVFVTMNPDIERLRQWLGTVADQIEALGLKDRWVAQHQQSTLPANWKNCVDVFIEIYHLHAVHPQTQPVMEDDAPITLYTRGMSSFCLRHAAPAKRYPDQTGLNEGLRKMLQDAGLDPASYKGSAGDVRGDIQVAKRENAAKLGLDCSKLTEAELTDCLVINIFPNVQISAQLEATYIIRFMPDPHEPTRFIYDNMTLVPQGKDDSLIIPDWLPATEDVSADMRPDIERVPFGEIPDLGLLLNQDVDIVPVMQRGLQSRGFRGPLWSEQELRLKHFHAELDRYIAGEME